MVIEGSVGTASASSGLAFRHVLLRGDPRVEDGRLLEPDRPQGLPLQPSTATLSFH